MGADDRRIAAIRSGSLAELDALLAQALTYVHSSSRIDTKASYLDSLQSGRVKYQRVERRSPYVRLLSDTTAVMHGQAELDVLVAGQLKLLNGVFQSIWTASGQNSAWQMAGWSMVLLPAGKLAEGL